jgi:hypothetical protein
MTERERERAACEAERHMVPSDDWRTCGAPLEAVALAEAESEAGYPTGIARHPTLGWMVLMSGQGPFIAWWEGDAHE